MGVVIRDAMTVACTRAHTRLAGRGVRWLLAGALLWALAVSSGCSGHDSSQAAAGVGDSQPTPDPRREPCEVVTREVLATTFALPVLEIEQSSMSSLCVYHWAGGDELLDVTLHLSAVTDDAADARARFEEATAEPAGKAAPQAEPAFEELAGLGDQARVDTRNGDVHVLRDRFYFTLNAYYGPGMPAARRPPVLPSGADARARWVQATLPQRRQAATELARTAVYPQDQ